MVSHADGSQCGSVARETLECGSGSGAMQDSLALRIGHSSKEQGSLLGTGGVLFWSSGNPV